jgi:hypothetical protein
MIRREIVSDVCPVKLVLVFIPYLHPFHGTQSRNTIDVKVAIL